jgi:hypothetical protein
MLEDCLLPSSAELEAIARETHLIQRVSHRFSALGLLRDVRNGVDVSACRLNIMAPIAA